jgi:uncharacterized protein with von Willebrand factor type A (vWA) domain
MTIRSKRVSGKQAIHYRNYRRVRDRALSRLSQAYPETYKELLELEKVNDATSGAKWVGIDGSSSFTVGISAGESGREPVGDPKDIAEGEGDNE